MVDAGRRPVEVGLQALGIEHEPFDPLGQILDRLAIRAPHHLAAHPAEQLGADVAILVDAVPKAHHHFFCGELLMHPRVGPVGRADVGEHLQHLLVGAAVQRALERTDRGRDAGMHVGAGGDDRAGGERGSVELVLRVEHERGAEDGDMLLRRHVAGEPLEQRLGDGTLRPGGDAAARGEIHPCGQDRRHLAEQLFGLGDELLPGAGQIVLLDLAEHADAGAQGIHRRGVGSGDGEPLEAVAHGGIERPGRLAHAAGKRRQFRRRGQFAVEQQVGDLLEVARKGQRLDRVAAVAEVAVKRADRRAAGDDAGQAAGKFTGGRLGRRRWGRRRWGRRRGHEGVPPECLASQASGWAGS